MKHGRDGKHAYLNFLLASHEGPNGATLFLPCIAFDATAINIDRYITVGDRVLLLGKLIQDKYAQSKYKFKFQVSSFEFVETKKDHHKNFDKQMDRILQGGKTHES